MTWPPGAVTPPLIFVLADGNRRMMQGHYRGRLSTTVSTLRVYGALGKAIRVIICALDGLAMARWFAFHQQPSCSSLAGSDIEAFEKSKGFIQMCDASAS